VHTPVFTIPVRDLEQNDQRRHWDVSPEWIAWAMAESEADSTPAAGSLELYLKKNGREVLVKGEARAVVSMPCARTLEPVDVSLVAPILLLLAPRKGAAPGPPGRTTKGGERRKRRETVEESELSAEEAARDEYDGETVILDEFVREHLLLELPLFPVRSDLPFAASTATDTPPGESAAAEKPLDPRLAPLAALASQMRRTDKE
jgi:uncharacterized protein